MGAWCTAGLVLHVCVTVWFYMRVRVRLMTLEVHCEVHYEVPRLQGDGHVSKAWCSTPGCVLRCFKITIRCKCVALRLSTVGVRVSCWSTDVEHQQLVDQQAGGSWLSQF